MSKIFLKIASIIGISIFISMPTFAQVNKGVIPESSMDDKGSVGDADNLQKQSAKGHNSTVSFMTSQWVYPAGSIPLYVPVSGILSDNLSGPLTYLDSLELLVPTNCTFGNLRGRVGLGYPGSDAIFTLMVNRVASRYKCDFAGKAVCAGSGIAPTVRAGDLVVWQITSSSPTTFIHISTLCE